MLKVITGSNYLETKCKFFFATYISGFGIIQNEANTIRALKKGQLV